MSDKIEDEFEILNEGESTKSTRKIHGVLFFIPQATLNDPNQSQTRELIKQNFASMVSRGNKLF